MNAHTWVALEEKPGFKVRLLFWSSWYGDSYVDSIIIATLSCTVDCIDMLWYAHFNHNALLLEHSPQEIKVAKVISYDRRYQSLSFMILILAEHEGLWTRSFYFSWLRGSYSRQFSIRRFIKYFSLLIDIFLFSAISLTMLILVGFYNVKNIGNDPWHCLPRLSKCQIISPGEDWILSMLGVYLLLTSNGLRFILTDIFPIDSPRKLLLWSVRSSLFSSLSSTTVTSNTYI